MFGAVDAGEEYLSILSHSSSTTLDFRGTHAVIFISLFHVSTDELPENAPLEGLSVSIYEATSNMGSYVPFEYLCEGRSIPIEQQEGA